MTGVFVRANRSSDSVDAGGKVSDVVRRDDPVPGQETGPTGSAVLIVQSRAVGNHVDNHRRRDSFIT
ncbi:MAG: hypothetical protein WA931_17560 [Rhodococcus sp. (in: high G+C Gram-positive bacteria)]